MEINVKLVIGIGISFFVVYLLRMFYINLKKKVKINHELDNIIKKAQRPKGQWDK